MRISVRQRIGPGVGTLCLVLGALFLPRPASAQDQQPTQPSSSQKDNQVSQRRGLGVIFATDGRPLQSALDFYREVFTALSQSGTWDAVPIKDLRRALAGSKDAFRIGGIPSIDRDSFRTHLPRRPKKGGAKASPAGTVPELQRMLDNLRAPAALVVDCPRKDAKMLKSCALYYYDRVSSKVVASAVKRFTAGANEATGWAAPLLKSLETGISAAQAERDQAIIEELVARSEDDEDKDVFGIVAAYGKGDRMRIDTGWSQTVAGVGLQLGVLKDNIGAVADLGYLSWTGSSQDVTRATRLNLGLSMLFRAHALDSLLWLMEIGGGKERSTVRGNTDDDSLEVEGLYASISPGIGLELTEFLSLNLSIGWRWFFESSSSRSGALKDVSMDDTHGPSLAFRAMILL